MIADELGRNLYGTPRLRRFSRAAGSESATLSATTRKTENETLCRGKMPGLDAGAIENVVDDPAQRVTGFSNR